MVIKMISIRHQVDEKIKEYSKEEYLDGYIKNEFLTDDGKADIILNINNKDELFDSRTSGNQLDLNRRIYDYIEEKSAILNNDIQISLCITGINLNQNEEGKIKHIINEHYAIELYKMQRKYRRYKTRIFKLALLGLFFLACYGIISILFSSKFFLEVFGFLFSFTLWEAFDTLIYTLSEIKLHREAITQRLIMNIKFDKKND